MPLVWAGNVVTLAKQEGLIKDEFSVKTLLTELCSFRGKCGTLLDYDWISVPLVYTQVVTLAVYTYFLATLFAFQMVDRDNGSTTVDLYFPVLAVLEFFFYMGWLKVAEVLINPFGDDDEDFDVGWMVDRNIQVTYLIVDKMHHEHPELIKDRYWSNMAPQVLPHTIASGEFFQDIPVHSTTKVNVKVKDQDFYLPDGNSEDTVDDGSRRRKTWWPKLCKVRKEPRMTELRRVSTDSDIKENSQCDPTVSTTDLPQELDGSEDAFELLKLERQQKKQANLKLLLDYLKSNIDKPTIN